MSILIPTGMDSVTGLFKVAQSGDSLSLGSSVMVTNIYIQTADKTITNTVAETSVIGTGIGSMTLPANFFAAGRAIRMKLAGIYSTPAIVASSVLINIKLGATVIATGTTTSLATSASGLRFSGDAVITCRTAGVSGTFAIDCGIMYNISGSDIPVNDPLNNGGAEIVVNTTIPLIFDITATWDTATSTRIVKSTTALLEMVS